MRREAITDERLKHFQDAYPGQTISKKDLFYYVYGILHSEEYRKRYADTLRKELPRIPRVKTHEAFKAFSDAGRTLGEMHVNFDSQPIYDGVKVDYGKGPLTSEAFRVEKMKYSTGKDKSTLHYNDRITVTGIPLELFLQVLTISLETMKIVKSLPALDILEN